MSTDICALCPAEINPNNDSREHIIPNSIGGRKKVSGFICINCNSNYGYKWDSVLAKKLNPYCLLLMIKRERGVPPKSEFVTDVGNKINLKHDGSMDIAKPKIEEEKIGDKVHVKVVARDFRTLKTKTKEVIKKYPQAKEYFSEMLEKANNESFYCNDYINLKLDFGCNESLRSVIKTALSLAVESGVNSSLCEVATKYLLHEDTDPCFGYYYEKDLVKNRIKGQPFHCVRIQGDAKSRKLLAYIEYFGMLRMITLLSKNYIGNEIDVYYAIDPTTGKELDIAFNIQLTSINVQDVFDGTQTRTTERRCRRP